MNLSKLRKFTLALGLFTLLTSVPLSSNQASVPPSRYRFFIQAPSRTEMRRLSGWLNRNAFDVAGVNVRSGTVEVLTNSAGLKLLQSKGLHGRVVNIPVAGGKSKSLTGLDARYLNPERVAERLKNLNTKYPEVTRLLEIGRSLNNLPIYALVISTTPDLADPKFHEKPTVFFDGMHHAREIMTPEIVLDIGDSLLSAARRVKRARSIVENLNVILLPMLNVDGNTRVWNQDNMWRKNAHAFDSKVYGVDINRNYPYRWADCNGSSPNKNAQDYRGESAASEPETKAFIGLAERIRPVASISYHSYSELVLYPFGCNGSLTSENALLKKLGGEMAKLLPTDDGRGFYKPGTPWEILYSVDGDSMNYLYASFGAVAYTFEVNEDFQPSYEMRNPTVKKHRAAWQYFLDQVQTHMLQISVRDAQGRPVAAEISIAEVAHRQGEREFSTNPSGNFFKVLLNGKYTIRVKGANGRSGVADVMMADRSESVTITLQ